MSLFQLLFKQICALYMKGYNSKSNVLKQLRYLPAEHFSRVRLTREQTFIQTRFSEVSIWFTTLGNPQDHDKLRISLILSKEFNIV